MRLADRRTTYALLALLAALVVPAAAGAADPAPGGLKVSAGLEGCIPPIACKVGVSWSGVSGAERYTGSVTLPDGAVRELGTIGSGPGGGARSLWIPYSGNGTYSIVVTAWGEDARGKQRRLTRP